MPAWDETGFGVPGPKPYELHWSEEEIIKLKDDIDRLRADNERLAYEVERWKHVAENKWGIDDMQKYQDEIDRLRAENAELRKSKADAAAQNDDLFQDETLRNPDRP